MFKFCYSEFLTNVSLLKYRIQYRHKKSVIRFIGLTKISQRSVSGKLHEFKKKKKILGFLARLENQYNPSLFIESGWSESYPRLVE